MQPQQYQKHYANGAEVLRDSDSETFNANNKIVKERIWITVKLTIQNRVAKADVEPNATSWTFSRSSRPHVRDVTNVKRSGEWLNMESKNFSYSLKVNEFADFDNLRDVTD